MGYLIAYRDRLDRVLAVVLVIAAAAYIGWKITESPEQAVQFAFNGLSVGAVYALLAIGFTLVYSTVWFFDLYYGAAAAMGAYGVFYLRSKENLGGLYHTHIVLLNVLLAVVVAGVVAWALHERFYNRLRARYSPRSLRMAGGLLAALAGAYTGLVLAYSDDIHLALSPAVGVVAAAALAWILRRGSQLIHAGTGRVTDIVIVAVSVAVGAGCAILVANAPGSKLYLSWVVSCLLAGTIGLAFYRGLYVYMRQRARSPLIMLVASLGILLAITAATAIVFESAPRTLPEAFGSDPWTIWGGNIKGFNVFTIGVAVVGFLGLLFLLKRTSFGKAVRAIGDDEEVSKVVGINTTVVIAVVFFIGAAFAALAGVLSGHDTAIQPRMGLLLLLKGWIASVVGGIGNLYGAIVGGFALGLVEQFGIWDLAGEWKDIVSFLVLVLILLFWPNGLLPRK